jgi:outer membrane lipoprotein-sorting protein
MTFRAASLILLVTFTACHKRIEFGPQGRIENAQELLTLVSQNEQQVKGISGEGKLYVEAPAGKGSLSSFVSAHRPSFIRVETTNFFGKPVGMMVSDGAQMGFYSVEENVYYVGPATEKNLSLFVPATRPIFELVLLMLGEAPRIAFETLDLTLDDQKAAYKLTLKSGALQQVVWVHPKHLRVVRSETFGADAYVLTYDDFESIGGFMLPRVVRLETAKGKVELRYQGIQLNERADPSQYEREVPEGVTVKHLN